MKFDPSSKFDPKAAIEFAQKFGGTKIMCFRDGKCLHPDSFAEDDFIKFIEVNKDADIYFTPADLVDAFLGKPKKSDCKGSRFAWVDIDPPKGMTDPDKLEIWRTQTLADIKKIDIPLPQIIVFSGRGFWLYWRLSCFTTADSVEATNYGLADRFDGGDSCHSIDHVARLPYTRNSKTGLYGCVLKFEDGCTRQDELPSLEPEVTENTAAVDLPDFYDVAPCPSEDAFRELIEGLSCTNAKKEDLLLSALDPAKVQAKRDEPFDINDRSSVMFSWVIKALIAGMAPCDVKSCIISPALPWISDHLLDPKKVPPSVFHRVTRRQIQRAHAYIAKNELQPDALSDGEAIAPLAQAEEAEPTPIELISLAPVPTDLPARPWLVESLLMDGQVTMITGRGGEGKSLLALQLAIMIAMGTEFAYWKPTAAKKVLLLNAEDDIDEQRRRFIGACELMGADERYLENRLFTLNTQRLFLVGRNPQNGGIETSDLYQKLVQAIKEHDIGLLIIDPLVEAHEGLDENSNTDMKELILRLRNLARIRHIPILAVHHNRKGSTKGDQDSARGGSALVNACRTVITMERMTGEEHLSIKPPKPKERYVRLTGAKANYAGRIDDRWLEMKPIKILSGDYIAPLDRVVLGSLEEGFDPHTWTLRDKFIELVRSGTGDRPWSAAESGPKKSRLDAAVSTELEVDARQAKSIIAAFSQENLIIRSDWKGKDRKDSKIWYVAGDEPPEGTQEMPF